MTEVKWSESGNVKGKKYPRATEYLRFNTQLCTNASNFFRSTSWLYAWNIQLYSADSQLWGTASNLYGNNSQLFYITSKLYASDSNLFVDLSDPAKKKDGLFR